MDRVPVYCRAERQTTIYTHRRLAIRVANEANMHVFGLWKEATGLERHRENMQLHTERPATFLHHHATPQWFSETEFGKLVYLKEKIRQSFQDEGGTKKRSISS